MAIAPTGAIYKSLIFDGEDSRDYGVYITGQAVFNAPERDVEMITIPGRNGEFALDQGRFENITVTYPAGIFADTEADFAQAISDFRNFLCSRKGYCRLTDDYNPDEYRMGIYKSGLDVKPAQLKAGEFNITFDCKPHRFLTSGETPVTMPGKNLIPYPYYNSSGHTDAGITFTVKNDGTIVMNGTASASPYFRCVNNTQDPYLSSGTEYIMSQTTNTNKSLVVIYFFDANRATITIPCSITYDDGTIVNANRSSISLNYGGINHTWCKFSFTSSDPVYTATGVRLLANAGTVTDATVQPMIRLASETDPHYVRYNGIYNPTLFEASPMLEVTGYGAISIGEQPIAVENSLLGEIKISFAQSAKTYTATASLQTSNLNTGDSIYRNGSAYILLSIAGVSSSVNVTVQSITNGTYTYRKLSSREAELRIIPTLPTYANGTFRQDIATISLTINVGGTDYNCTYTVTTQYKSNQTVVITGQKGGTWPSTSLLTTSTRCYLPAFYGDSTKSVMPTPLYIDLDLGEAYGEVNGEMLSFNNTVSMPAKLPTLKDGTNEIAYSNTVTDLKIIPRWWKI